MDTTYDHVPIPWRWPEDQEKARVWRCSVCQQWYQACQKNQCVGETPLPSSTPS